MVYMGSRPEVKTKKKRTKKEEKKIRKETLRKR